MPEPSLVTVPERVPVGPVADPVAVTPPPEVGVTVPSPEWLPFGPVADPVAAIPPPEVGVTVPLPVRLLPLGPVIAPCPVTPFLPRLVDPVAVTVLPLDEVAVTVPL